MALLVYKRHTIGGGSNINDETVSATSTYSSKKIDETYATSEELTQEALTGTMPALQGKLSFNYPDGFTKDNTYILMSCVQSSSGAWTNAPNVYNYGTGDGDDRRECMVFPIQYALRDDTIDIICRDKYSEGLQFKVILGKYK